MRLERVMGIEPTFLAWEATFLPLEDTRVGGQLYRGAVVAIPRRQNPLRSRWVLAYARTTSLRSTSKWIPACAGMTRRWRTLRDCFVAPAPRNDGGAFLRVLRVLRVESF